MERKQIKIKKNGKDFLYEVISTYHDDNTGKDFIIYTDKTFDTNSNLMIHSSLYKDVNGDIKLFDIIDNYDKKIVFELIKELLQDNS